MKYTKVRFTSKLNGNTAGLVLTDHQQESMTITQVSKLFPISESMKMERLERSDSFNTFEEAFLVDMDHATH